MQSQNLGVFSAQAEVFLIHTAQFCTYTSFLRASGGVSHGGSIYAHNLVFSPRKRRCFSRIPSRARSRAVFSAQAEVFLHRINATLNPSGFLRASGGVSNTLARQDGKSTFSPRKRRCFQ